MKKFLLIFISIFSLQLESHCQLAQPEEYKSIPGCVNPVYPPPNAGNVSINPTFKWNEVQGASTYSLQVSTLESFIFNIIDEGSLTTTKYTVDKITLPAFKTYFWRVKANGITRGIYCWIYVFTTG